MIEFRIGDVFARLAEIPDGSIDLVVTSPPFLALRSYLPADHPDKHLEIGSEATPADFLDTLLALTAEWGRVLAPHGSICVELGDTFSGSGQSGWERDTGEYRRENRSRVSADGRLQQVRDTSVGWPLAKSLTGIPTLYTWSLAYGRNLLTGQPSPAGQWRIRNVIVWARPNPPVGALGDKFRPATSYITVACKSSKRYFDLDAVRYRAQDQGVKTTNGPKMSAKFSSGEDNRDFDTRLNSNPAGAPPLDWHTDNHPEDGDWLWKLPTQPYRGWTTTDRRVPCGPDDGGERTTSPDCPVHGDQADQAPTARRGGRGAERQAESPRTSRTGDRHEPEPLPGFAPTAPSSERSTEPPAPSPEGARVATPHSTASRRTGLALATSPAGTPSVQSPDGIARTSASPESCAPDRDSDESSTSPVDSVGSRPQSPGHTPGTHTEPSPCSCSFHRVVTESTSHYAVYPEALPRRLIEAMCPQRVCRVCGKPSERIVENHGYAINDAQGGPRGVQGGPGRNGDAGRFGTSATTTTGWTDCGHDDWRTGVVLDPFVGSGTTLAVALGVGRHAIGTDLDARNADLARERVGMFLTVDHGGSANVA